MLTRCKNGKNSRDVSSAVAAAAESEVMVAVVN